MSAFPGLTWTVVLSFANLIFASAIVLTAFSLLGYMLTRNFHSSVAQTFSILLACVLVVLAGDIVIPRVEAQHAVLVWLRVQWIGIAMVPAAYLHFSDAILRTTRHFSSRRRMVVAGSYLFSVVLVMLALFTELLVYDGDFQPPINHLAGGPLFPLFVAYFIATAVYGALQRHPRPPPLPDPRVAPPDDLSDPFVCRARAWASSPIVISRRPGRSISARSPCCCSRWPPTWRSA